MIKLKYLIGDFIWYTGHYLDKFALTLMYFASKKFSRRIEEKK